MICSHFKGNTFTAVKRNKKFQTRFVKGVPFINRRCTKRIPFLSKMVYKGWGIRTRGGVSPIKFFWVPPGLPRAHKHAIFSFRSRWAKECGYAWLPRGRLLLTMLTLDILTLTWTSFVYHKINAIGSEMISSKHQARSLAITSLLAFTTSGSGGSCFEDNKMKMFSFYCHGLGYLFRLITMSIFRAFNRFLRLDKSEGVYQDCEGNDTTGMPFFWHTVIQRVLLV